MIAVVLVGPVRLVVSAQSPIDLTTDAAFEVASIRRNVSGASARGRREPGRFTSVSTPVVQLIRLAFDSLPDDRLLNAPEWARSERYDIVASLPDGAPQLGSLAPHIRALLRDRFGFQAHVEAREMPIYELRLARADGRLGSRLQPAACDCAGKREEPGCRQGPPLASFSEFDGATCARLGNPGRQAVRGYSMLTVAGQLSGLLERVVVDKTGLTGTWNMELEFAPDPAANTAADKPPADAPSLFTAVQEQLGLRLQPARGSVDVLVIDRIERPMED